MRGHIEHPVTFPQLMGERADFEVADAEPLSQTWMLLHVALLAAAGVCDPGQGDGCAKSDGLAAGMELHRA
jgi:hypothetical protein